MALFRRSVASEFRGRDKRCYDLKYIANFLKVDYEKARDELLEKGSKNLNDHIACKCILSLLKHMKLDSIPILKTNCQMPLNELPHVYASTNERPDVVIYSHDKATVITVIEVNSSPMIQTERKATFYC